MKNKIIIILVVPSLMKEFEIFIPVNERISKIKELILNCISDLSNDSFDKNKSYSLIDPETGTVYSNNMIVRDTTIKNSKKIILY